MEVIEAAAAKSADEIAGRVFGLLGRKAPGTDCELVHSHIQWVLRQRAGKRVLADPRLSRAPAEENPTGER